MDKNKNIDLFNLNYMILYYILKKLELIFIILMFEK